MPVAEKIDTERYVIEKIAGNKIVKNTILYKIQYKLEPVLSNYQQFIKSIMSSEVQVDFYSAVLRKQAPKLWAARWGLVRIRGCTNFIS
ncbi:hypothetical protein L3Y34_000589 [Caenorhabditis briggsae]|uniref:Uncharacterized protein n=1 Tax=Caenorhabditis briggsae TaxID=6238 RepID=A0AAE9D9M6_CAEBR|nr:hypothetical protein L3Y34_000589 [Caenorhabditis briggsae]